MRITTVSGIRGLVNTDLGANDYAEIGRSFGEYIDGGVCAIGKDTRASGFMASNAAISGLLSSGCTVLDLGVTSTPSVFREVLRENLNGGLVITASHNPPDWNGVKFVVNGGRGLFEEELNQLQKIFSSRTKQSFKTGSVFPAESQYPTDVVSYVGAGSCSKLKVVLDLGGGAGCMFVPNIFRELGCKVLTVNGSPSVFSRGMDPTRDKLTDLSEAVNDSSADIGVAYDCDADRVVFIDNEGTKLRSDYVLLIYLKYLSDSGLLRNIAVNVDTSLAAEDIVEKSGFKVIRSKVGEANVVQRMIEEKISIGCEGSSGGLIISDFNFCRDGVLASALIASAIVKQNESLASIIKSLPQYYCFREKMNCMREEAYHVLKTLSEEEDGNIDSIDGVRIIMNDRSWVLIRPSNTENIIRISVEAKTEKTASTLMNRYKDKISKILKEGVKS